MPIRNIFKHQCEIAQLKKTLSYTLTKYNIIGITRKLLTPCPFTPCPLPAFAKWICVADISEI